MAAVTLLQEQAELSLEDHLQLSTDILESPPTSIDGELRPLIMAQAVPDPPADRRRVKVYELRSNDWFDRGTGFCVATPVSLLYKMTLRARLSCPLFLMGKQHRIRGSLLTRVTQGDGEREDPRIVVQSEEAPDRLLLETRICKEDGFQKQQGTHGRWS